VTFCGPVDDEIDIRPWSRILVAWRERQLQPEPTADRQKASKFFLKGHHYSACKDAFAMPSCAPNGTICMTLPEWVRFPMEQRIAKARFLCDTRPGRHP
jgi:hypothetical protein